MLRGKNYFTTRVRAVFHLLMANTHTDPTELMLLFDFYIYECEYRDSFQSIELCLLPRQKEKTTFILVTTQCYYRFTNPYVPSFKLPAAQTNSPDDTQPNSSGDTMLNSGYPIQFFYRTLSTLGCNTGKCSYQTPNETFSSTYIDSNGQSSSMENQFSVTPSGD